MKAAEIRSHFLDYFIKQGHEYVPSSSLVPHDDPSLLFTNAGMVQFKQVFLGHEHPSYKRAVSSQKCVRAGGKHNDLENVGHTARHHTFFEMLGNFSFGDYFKKEAIHYAWDFLTKVLHIDSERLFVTVFEEDDEAADIWLREIGIHSTRLARIGAKDNFWSMGDTGPCGPCSEIFYDHGEAIAGGPPGTPEEDGDRFVEIWNLVFMQYNRDEQGKLSDLPNPCVDTGMGLERIAAVMQAEPNNYDIDLFKHLIQAIAQQLGDKAAKEDRSELEIRDSMRVIADHLRSVSFLLADGVLPSNEGRGFVLRRILRRACRHGRLLGMRQAFIYRLLPALVEVMGDHFKELTAQQETIAQIIRIEEERFLQTLDKGLKLVEQAVLDAGDQGVIEGKVLFTLYDTYGFPVDLTEDILKGSGIQLDYQGFESCMNEQRQRARAAWSGSGDVAIGSELFELREQHGASAFLGYQCVQAEAVVTGLLNEQGEAVSVLHKGDKATVLLNQTPFYGESGGQQGDTGCLRSEAACFVVADCKKPLSDMISHIGIMQEGSLRLGQLVHAEVDAERRLAIARNHTATHLLQKVLQTVLGEHVKQAGSLVTADRLRFDFSHFTALSDAERQEIEDAMNAAIWENDPVQTKVMSYDEALASGAMALFGEKYEDDVRVVSAGSSVELCGGTHVQRTGDLAQFRLLSEVGVAAGTRRIEAITATAAYAAAKRDRQLLQQASQALKVVSNDGLSDAITQLQQRLKDAERQLLSLKGKQSSGLLDQLIAEAIEVDGVSVLAVQLKEDMGPLRDLMDKAKSKLKSGLVLFAYAPSKQKVQLVIGVSKDLNKQFQAGKLMQAIAPIVGGKGGGKPDLAMGGGTDAAKIPEAINAFLAQIKP